MASDPISPSYYASLDPEPRRVIRKWRLGFNLGSAIKYIARAGKKDPSKHIEDLEKAKRYIEMEIEDLMEESP